MTLSIGVVVMYCIAYASGENQRVMQAAPDMK